jgi:hypothetical protein
MPSALVENTAPGCGSIRQSIKLQAIPRDEQTPEAGELRMVISRKVQNAELSSQIPWRSLLRKGMMNFCPGSSFHTGVGRKERLTVIRQLPSGSGVT